MEDLVAVAKIVRPRGLKGEVVADILTDFPERFESLEDVTGVRRDGERIELKIEQAWFQNDRVVLKFSDHDTIDAAEALRDCEICVAESQAIELEDDEFYDWELEGCKVETVDGLTIGDVSGLMRTGGTELLIVKSKSKEHLIPFAKAICIEIDVENKLIRIDPPAGLLEF